MNTSGSLAAFTGIYVVFLLALVVFYFASWWKILEKSGDKGWKVLIPFYGEYCMYKAVDSTGLFWATLILSVLSAFIGQMVGSAAPGSAVQVIFVIVFIIAALTIAIKYAINTAHAFGKSGGFTVGLLFLQPIFIGILAFGSARHRNQGSLTETEQTY